MDHHTFILLIAAVAALGLLVVLRWIFAPRRRPQGDARREPPVSRPQHADGAWDGAARRRRDLAT
jgi:hypothetical protein